MSESESADASQNHPRWTMQNHVLAMTFQIWSRHSSLHIREIAIRLVAERQPVSECAISTHLREEAAHALGIICTDTRKTARTCGASNVSEELVAIDGAERGSRLQTNRRRSR
jgi:hypothetical protein